jgi:hypothetical protein
MANGARTSPHEPWAIFDITDTAGKTNLIDQPEIPRERPTSSNPFAP